MTNYLPKTYHVVTPFLVFKDTNEAIEIYKKAFGAKEKTHLECDETGRVEYAEITIGDSVIMMGDENSDEGYKSPVYFGGSPVRFYVYFPDIRKVYKKALSVGMTGEKEPSDMFWGDSIAMVVDQFGYEWTLAQHVKDVLHDDMQKIVNEKG